MNKLAPHTYQTGGFYLERWEDTITGENLVKAVLEIEAHVASCAVATYDMRNSSDLFSCNGKTFEMYFPENDILKQ